MDQVSKRVSRVRQDSGSIAPLGIGLFLFIIAMTFSIVCASSMFIFQKRLTTIAEAASVFVSSGGELAVFNENVVQRSFTALRITDQLLQDGLTTEVVACALWAPPVPFLVPLSSQEICSHAAARSGG